MIIARSKQELRHNIALTRKEEKTIGFVPTMGALHDGHLSLIDLAKQHSNFVAVSIFVNPTQFAPNEDFDSYPRDEEADADKLKSAGVDLLYLPTQSELYPEGMDSDVKAGKAAQGLETDFRPHFFDGVVNIVHRLFDHVKPDTAIFGEKDFQQLMVIKEMVATLSLPIKIIGAPISRDGHGLALSSRNAYLSPEELKIARTLNKVLTQASQDQDLDNAKQTLLTQGFDKVDYIDARWNRVLAAAWLGKTRLIDNTSI